MTEIYVSVWWKRWLKKGWPYFLTFIVGLLIGLPLDGVALFHQVFGGAPQGYAQRLGQTEFTNHLLFCDSTHGNEFKELQTLQNILKKKIQVSKDQHLADSVSIYFRDLNSGHWTGVNENDSYVAASLIKVPIMISYYKNTESKPDILSQLIKFEGGTDLNATQNFKPALSLRVGQIYSVGELIDSMIRYSENNAAEVLTRYADSGLIERTYHDLDIPIIDNASQEQIFTPRDYSYFFRALYNETYLNHEMSERALRLLSQTEFKDGLVAGVPTGTVVAHKFGERTFLGDDQKTHGVELHDCGIVYYPNHPYFLCVMTRGSEFTPLTGAIQTISKTVYDFVDQTSQAQKSN